MNLCVVVWLFDRLYILVKMCDLLNPSNPSMGWSAISPIVSPMRFCIVFEILHKTYISKIHITNHQFRFCALCVNLPSSNIFNRSKPKMTNAKKAVLTKSSCDKSPMCPAKKTCPVGAITQKTTSIMFAGYPVIDEDTCIGCGACVDSCRGGAIRMN